MGLAKPNLELTTTRKRLLQLYQSHLDAHGAPPSIRWLARELEMYPFAVRYQLQKLEEAGLLRPAKKQITVMRLSAKARKAAL